jgi:NADPH:quinone reductase-like Zn-dependent oxidoreductase
VLFPDWQDGGPTIGNFTRTPGGIDGFAHEHVVLPATAFTHAPKGYDAVEAATITTGGLTAWRALVVNGKLKPGDTVLQLGTGGVSIWALQIARLMGAKVAITSSSGEKLERAQRWVPISSSTIASMRIGAALCAIGPAAGVLIMS